MIAAKNNNNIVEGSLVNFVAGAAGHNISSYIKPPLAATDAIINNGIETGEHKIKNIIKE